ncbi:ClbS/DfsB family four-helix bundle protein [Utexia brackfieldae]|uniref:ClbS/DfsB family four-helix bundle protein n=1 Tax=Utexia brackfieldae TaxID=3074108 RepID=UPI00370DB252
MSGEVPILPAEGYKWNNLGELYQSFYRTYQGLSLKELIQHFKQMVGEWNGWINLLTEETLFIKDRRNWTKPYPENWTVAKFIHINSITPFKSFRSKIRKWKKIAQ